MTVAQLAHPEWFEAVLWTLIAVGSCIAIATWRGRRRRVLLMGSERDATPRKWTSDWALWIALSSIGIALVGPRIGERLIEASGSGVDLVLVIDVSRSMDAQDTPPSRLDRARRGIEELLARLSPTDRVALAVFASRGVLLAPLTPDRDALIDWIAALDTDLIRPASSNLAAGIGAAIEAFEAGSSRPRVIVVASDGEDPAGNSELGIAQALGAQSRVIAIALGTELGSAIPASGAPLRDRVGRVVVTRRESDRLARLANATGGVVFLADAWGVFDFDAVAKEIRRDAGRVEGERVVRRVQAIRVVPFAALAIVLLLAEGMPRPRMAFGHRTGAVIGVALAMTLIGAAPGQLDSSPSTAAEFLDRVKDHLPKSASRVPPPEAIEPWVRREPHNARALIALGHSRFAHGQAAAAASAFEAAALYATDERIAAHSHYGLGVARLENGDFEAARDAFFDALAFDPSDDKARFNLEWTLAAMIENPPGPTRPDDESEQDSDTESEPDDRDETDEPEPASAEEPEPEPGAEPDTGPSRGDPLPSQLTERQQLRSLARVTDDLERSIRAAVRADEPDHDRRAGDAW